MVNYGNFVLARGEKWIQKIDDLYIHDAEYNWLFLWGVKAHTVHEVWQFAHLGLYK